MSFEYVALYLIAVTFVYFLSVTYLISNSRDSLLQIHYGFFFLFALLGICNLLFALFGIRLTLKNINVFFLLACSIVYFHYRLAYSSSARSTSKITLSADGRTVFCALTSYSSALLCGFLLFSLDLVPSSMTGDPARHLLRIQELALADIPKPAKSIYPTLGLFVVKSFQYFPIDKVFLLYNIFVLGLCTFCCMILLLRLYPASSYWHIAILSPLICFSYPFFSLIFGYYTLLFAAAFFFLALSLLIDTAAEAKAVNYLPAFVMFVGVIFSHSYLFPLCLLTIVFFSAWAAKNYGTGIKVELFRSAPYLALLIGIFLLLQKLSGYSTVHDYQGHLILEGYVNESFLLNIVPLIFLALVFLLREFHTKAAQLLSTFIGGALAYSLAMGALYKFGFVAPYYVNRNQVIVLPLLLLANFCFFTHLSKSHPRIAASLGGLILATFMLPFFLPKEGDVNLSAGGYRKLLQSDRFVFFENAYITRSSPLQMSAKDRELMLQIGQNNSKCFFSKPAKVATLGTDHQVVWFYIYTNIYPSLFFRNDGFIDFYNYENNFKIWLNDNRYEYIVVMRHFDFWRKQRILDTVSSAATLMCKGDSISVYRRTA